MAVDFSIFKKVNKKHHFSLIVALGFLISNPLLAVEWTPNEKNLQEVENNSFFDLDPEAVPQNSADEINLIKEPEKEAEPITPTFSFANGSFTYPAGSSIFPQGQAQTESQRREGYKALFKRIYGSSDVELVLDSFKYDSVEYPAGTLASMAGISGNFNSTITTKSFNITSGLALHPKRIAVFKSELLDAYGQHISWEEGYFERIFRVYLWGDYFETINETGIRNNGLDNYDILILPSVIKGYENSVVKKLGAKGESKLKTFVKKGNMLYGQGGSCYIAEAAGLVPNGTVSLNNRMEATYNQADMKVVNTSSILSQSWLSNRMYVIDDPVLNATVPGSVVAEYTGNLTNSSHLNTPAIMTFDYHNGDVVLTNGHPSVNSDFYPIFFDTMMLGMAEPPDLRARAKQIYNDEVPANLIPAQEPDIPVEVTINYLNFYHVQSQKKVNLTETISPLFYLDTVNITPAPDSIWYNSLNETMVSWIFDDKQGIQMFKFYVKTFSNTTKKGVVKICDGVGRYTPIGYKGKTEINHGAVGISAALAARLNGDRDIELDGCYPLPASGFYYDIALPLENKEETTAKNITITDIVVLKSPIVDVNNQTRVPDAWNNTNNGTGDPVFAVNEIFYYYDKNNNPLYPLPDEIYDTTYTYQFGNNGTNLTLPAKKLVWHYPDVIAYDYQEPAIRYGIFTHEEHNRTVSFLSDPIKGSVILNASGGSVFTNLGIHPVPYHEYLSHAVITIPKGEEIPRVDYKDIWNRNHTMELRTVFYDIVPFPPPEEHAVVTTTYEMTHEGERLQEFPIHHEVELNYKIKTWNGYGIYNATTYPYHLDLHKNETMIVQAIPAGVGYNIEYIESIYNENTTLTMIENTSMHTILYYQQYIKGGHKELIQVKANLSAYPEVHREGRMKINDGARFVYHQIAVGPSRYEVFDSHVQAVFAIGNDVTVDKRVAPVYIATFGDDVYQFIELEDPYEPREFMEDPYIKSHGFGDMAATTYVGGRTNETIHHSRVDPGDKTLVRIEVDNNLGYDLHNVSIIPVAPPGFKVSPDTFTTTVPPIFYDFPFINRTEIWDAWKSVYYFWVHVDPSVEGGKVYQINFTFKSDCANATYIPGDFELPPALIGVKDAKGHVEAIFGRAVELSLTDSMSSFVKPESVIIANTDEKSDFEHLIATGVSAPGRYNRSSINESFMDLRLVNFTTPAAGKVDFTLPEYAQMMPWIDNGTNKKTLFVILKTNVSVNRGGTYKVNNGPSVSYKNHFNETVKIKGDGETIEAHGPAFNYRLSILDIKVDNQPRNYLTGGKNNTLRASVKAHNFGDDIAESSVVQVRIPPQVYVDSSGLPSNAFSSGEIVYWSTGDIGPGSEKSLELVLFTIPPAISTDTNRGPPDPWKLIEFAQVKFTHGYLKKPVTVPASGPLYGQLFDSDLELSRIYYSHSFAATNYNHVIYAEVQNNWPYTDGIDNIKVNFSINGVYAGTSVIDSIAPGESFACTLDHTFTKEGTYIIKAVIVEPDMNEFYDNNNDAENELIVVDPVLVTSKPDFGTGKDTFVSSGDSKLNFGDQHNLKVGRFSTAGGVGSGWGVTRPVLEFDLSGIPTNALILDADLELYLYKSTGGTLPVTINQIQSGWLESGVSWSSHPSYDTTEISKINVDSTPGYRSWDVTASVKSWAASPTSNYGLIIKSGYEGVYWSKEFYSSDAENGLRPKLTVNYAMQKNAPDITRTKLTVADYKDRELRLEWTPVPYSLYYEVYRSDSAAGPFTKLGITWSFAESGGNGSLDNFFYDDIDGGYPEPPVVITTDRGGQVGTIRILWAAPSAPAASAVYYYRLKAIGVEGKTSGPSGSQTVQGQLTPEITNYQVYSSTSSSGPWTNLQGETSTTSFVHSGLGQGKVMYYRLKAESSEGYMSVLSKIVWGMSNRAPYISTPYISPSTAYTSDYLYAKYTFYDSDGDSESGTQIRWYRDGVQVTWYNDRTFIYPSSTVKGHVWYFTVNPKDGIEYGTVKTSGPITIQNSPPKLTGVRILPSAPITTDALNFYYTYSDADKDAEAVSQLKWYQNGIHQSAFDDKTSIPSTSTSKGDVWNASVRSSDGTDYCSWVNALSVTVKNSLPVASDVKISPANPRTGDQLKAVYTYSDLDNDQEKGTKIYWYKNGQYQSAYTDKPTIPSSATVKGDQWYFSVVPNDGEQAGLKVTSPTTKIDNSPPVITEMKLYPDAPRTRDDLTIWYTYFDADSDPESGTEVKWYRNDKFVSSLLGTTIVPYSETRRGDTWQYTITPRDGFNFGITYYSDTLIILNTGPDVTSALVDPAEPAVSDDLTITFEYTDADGDTYSDLEIKWFRNSEEVAELFNQKSVPNSYTGAGETWYYEIRLSDLFEFGPYFQSEPVTVNTPPAASNPKIMPDTPTGTDDLNAKYDWADIDADDNESGSVITWYRNGGVVDELENAVTVPSKMTAKGDEWFFTITPCDGKDSGELKVALPVMVLNSAPETKGLAILPEEPSVFDELSAYYEFIDQDGDTESTSIIKWYRNNEEVIELEGAETVSSAYLVKNDAWHFTVRPYDGESYGELGTSPAIIIANAPPVIDDAYINPGSPKTSDNLAAKIEFSDADGSGTFQFEFTWYRDNDEQGSLFNKDTVPAAATKKGQSWHFSVRVFDGEGWSSAKSSKPVLIGNSAPEITGIEITPYQPLTSTDLLLKYNFIDTDSDDEEGTRVTWYRNGKSVDSLNNKFLVPSETINSGDEWFAEIMPSDGTDLGVSVRSPKVTINHLPILSDIQLEFVNLKTDNIMDLDYTYSDADGDYEGETFITWYVNGDHRRSMDGRTSVPERFTQSGEIWYATIQPNDGKEYGQEYKSNEITIPSFQGSDPVMGRETADKNSGISSTMLFIILIILMVIILTIFFFFRRNRSGRQKEHGPEENILSINDAKILSGRDDIKGGATAGLPVPEEYFMDDLPVIPPALDENYVLVMDEYDPCTGCDGEMEGDLQHCLNCRKQPGDLEFEY